MRAPWPQALAVCLALLAVPLQADDLRVHVQLLAKGGKGPAKGSDVRQAIVYYEPAVPVTVKSAPVPFVMTTRRKEFDPRILVIPRGSRVRFPNEDPILHNVFFGLRPEPVRPRPLQGVAGEGEALRSARYRAGVL